MKTKILMLVALLFAITTGVNAQGMQRRTVEERLKSAMGRLTDSLQLSPDQQTKTSAVFTDFFTAQDKMREDARAGGNRPDRSVFQTMRDDRDANLKDIFTGVQYNTFNDNVEGSMTPQRMQVTRI